MYAAQNYEFIREASTTLSKEVKPFPDRAPLTYVNTNRLLKNANWDISLSKTGDLNESGRCLVMHAKKAGEPVFIVLLNYDGKLTPYVDSNCLRKWLLAQSSSNRRLNREEALGQAMNGRILIFNGSDLITLA